MNFLPIIFLFVTERRSNEPVNLYYYYTILYGNNGNIGNNGNSYGNNGNNIGFGLHAKLLRLYSNRGIFGPNTCVSRRRACAPRSDRPSMSVLWPRRSAARLPSAN